MSAGTRICSGTRPTAAIPPPFPFPRLCICSTGHRMWCPRAGGGDAAKAIAVGAGGVIIGTAELIAVGCVLCGNCESGRGCPWGITTTDPELSQLIQPEWGAQKISNLHRAWALQLAGALPPS